MPLNPVPNYYASLDSLPDPTAATYEDADGFEIDLLFQKLNAIVEKLEAKLGISESSAQDTPLADTILTSLTTGKTKWAKVLSAMLGLTMVEADLASDVALNNTSNFFDGPSGSLTSGTWIIWGGVTVTDTGGAASITAKLWDGTNVESQGQVTVAAAAYLGTIPVWGIVTVGSTTTWKISCRDGAATTGAIKAAPTIGATGNVASGLRALKVA